MRVQLNMLWAPRRRVRAGQPRVQRVCRGHKRESILSRDYDLIVARALIRGELLQRREALRVVEVEPQRSVDGRRGKEFQ